MEDFIFLKFEDAKTPQKNKADKNDKRKNKIKYAKPMYKVFKNFI
jgi:hypothetical protein